MLSACAPTVIPAGSAVRAPDAHARPLCRSRRHGAAGGRLARGKRPAQGGDPGPARLRRLPQGLGGAGGDLGQGRHHHLFLRPARLRQEPDARPLARHRSPGRRRQGDGAAAARPISRRAALPRRREHGRCGGPGRRRPRHRCRRADPGLARRCARARPSGRSPSGRPVVRRPHRSVVSQRPDLDRLPADRQSQDHGQAAGTIR